MAGENGSPSHEARPRPRLPVRVVGRQGASALVEWIDAEGMYRRAYVPLDRVRDNTVESRDLERGIPYGLPWEQWITIEVTPESIANDLRRRGVWTWADINNHAALLAANKAFDQGDFLRRVKQEVSK